MQFFLKNNWYNIPRKIKIWYGDDFIFYKALNDKKVNYKVEGSNILHLHSATSGSIEYEYIKQNDEKIFKSLNMIKKKRSLFERILSDSDQYFLRIN